MKFICQITVAFAVVVLSESFLLKPLPVKSCSMKKCPPGKTCVVRYGRPRCVRDPCTMVRCRPGTTCIVKDGKAYCQPDICSLPAVTGLCRAYFTRYFYNTSSARCDEFVYGGCGGNKNNFIKKVHCKAKCDDPACSSPLKTYQCKVAPCHVTKCPAYPDAKCVNNYCGGCFADFYLNGRKVDCKKIPDILPDLCAAVLCQVGHICVVRNGKASCEPACKSNSDCKKRGSYCNTESGACECSRFCPLVLSPINQCELNRAACEQKTTL